MTDRKPLVYIAGPISQGWLPANIRAAVEAADMLIGYGVIPFVPHTHGTLWEFVSPKSYEFWMELSFECVRRCDALYRIEGTSSGATEETYFARNLMMPVWTCKTNQGIWFPDADADAPRYCSTLDEWIAHVIEAGPR